MGAIADGFSTTFREYETDGVPSSGAHKVSKGEAKALGTLIEQTIGALLGSVTVAKTTKALLDADLAHAANTVALVYADATNANNDLYVKSGASDAGAWTNTGALHDIVDVLAEPFLSDLETLVPLLSTVTAGPITPDASGTEFSNPAIYFWPSGERDYDQLLTKVEVGVQQAGQFKIYVARHENDDTLTFVSSHLFDAPSTGARTFEGFSIAVPAGCVIGFQCNGNLYGYYTAGTIPGGELAWYIPDGNLGENTAKTNSGINGVHWRGTLEGEVIGKSRAGYALALELEARLGSQAVLGWSGIVATGDEAPSAYSIVFQEPAAGEGIVSQLVIGTYASGTADVLIVEMDPDTLEATVVNSVEVTLDAGVNNVELSLPISAGQFVGVGGGSYYFQANDNPEGYSVWYKNGAISSGDALISSAAHRYEVQFTIKTGLYASGGGGAGALGTGLDVLSTADATGALDATATFSSGRSSHPFPYVRPGLFSTTSLTAMGGGLWGPGRVFMGGERFFIPFRPAIGNLYHRFRAALMDAIAAGDVLTLIADSIGHFAFSETGAQHHFNRVTRFGNLGIAKDEPIMTALRPSSIYTPDFYGVTVTGTATTGTRGPLAESLILAAGASISFTGAYEQADVFYTQQAGAGSLAFSFNGGAAYKTVNANGATELDKFSGPSLTGQAGSGTYTITATGGPVEITGLLRLGVKVAGSAPRLRTLRAAHGSYSFGSFGAAEMASIVKMASYAGGKCLPIIALGINDSFGTTPAGLVATATAMIDALEAAGASRIYAIPPSKPTPVWDSIYTGGRTYEAAIGPLIRLYRQRGVIILPLDVADWQGEGLYQDGLHPNVLGNDRYAQIEVEGIAAEYGSY
jgi:hypothetical protein